jgi:two-component system sensor histidine kinase BaeS
MSTIMKMNSLLGKILLALLTSTLLALLVVSLIQRSILKRGFNDFLEQQEEVQLSYLVPELQDWYQRNGSWEDLKGDSRTWLRLLVENRPAGVRPPEEANLDERPRPFKAGREGERSNDRRMGKPPAPELRQLWRRLFLLDAERQWVAGKRGGETEAGSIQEIRVAGAVVGWVGFISAHGSPAPEARRFLLYQRNSLLVSALIALLSSILLGYWLARSISRPVTALRDSVQGLTDGDYSVRNEVRGSDEVATLGRQVNRLAKTLQANESARRRWTADT